MLVQDTAQAVDTGKVSAEMIQQAEWIAGLDLTENERKEAAGAVALGGTRTGIGRIRAIRGSTSFLFTQFAAFHLARRRLRKCLDEFELTWTLVGSSAAPHVSADRVRQRFGEAHAEVNALAAAGAAARGATLYVTLEPCSHYGKTPPCTDVVLQAGITRVVAALEDPFLQVAGQGAALLRAAGLAVEFGGGAELGWRCRGVRVPRSGVAADGHTE